MIYSEEKAEIYYSQFTKASFYFTDRKSYRNFLGLIDRIPIQFEIPIGIF
jgi:hypothetical protein